MSVRQTVRSFNGLPGLSAQFAAQAPQGGIRGVAASLDSFRDVTDPSILQTDPNRIDIVRVGRAQTLREFVERYPSAVPVGQLAVINHLPDGSARLQAGALIKRVVSRATLAWQ